MNEVLKAIKSRRSVRAYRQEQIKQEELEAIIEAGIYAPSANNQQPWHFTVIQNSDILRYINEKSKEQMAKSEIDGIRNMGANPILDITYQAPTLVIVSGKRDSITWRADCAAAIQNMLLAAESLNIGSVWLGLVNFLFKWEGEAAKLGIPEGYEPYYGVAFGYKAKESQQNAPKRDYDVVNYIK
ncbi:MAG: nitroreductase family protein [Hungatella sp.]|nr:nitroreductase family protein [Hungatella sp.]